jgi:hypothetical protein
MDGMRELGLNASALPDRGTAGRALLFLRAGPVRG